MNSIPEDLKKVLCACFECWITDPNPEDKREICYTWVATVYARLYGGKFHPSKLQQLAERGFLIAGDSARGGKRRYYTLADHKATLEFLEHAHSRSLESIR
jgi:hypothetical protein